MIGFCNDGGLLLILFNVITFFTDQCSQYKYSHISTVAVNGRDVSDFVFCYWVLDFLLWGFSFSISSFSLEIWSLKAFSFVISSRLTLDGQPRTLLEAMNGQMNLSMSAFLLTFLVPNRKAQTWNLKMTPQCRSFKSQVQNVVAIYGHHTFQYFHPDWTAV